MDPARRDALLNEIRQRAGGGAGVEAAKAELETEVGIELARQLATLTQGIHDTKALLGTRAQEMTERMKTSSEAASRHQRALVRWTVVLSVATIAYAVAAFLPLFWHPPTTFSAATERAWVLWEDFSGTAKATTEPVRAYSTKQDCDRGLANALDSFASGPNAVVRKDAKLQEVYVTLGTTTSAYRYVCLPDTVDPRGTKGK